MPIINTTRVHNRCGTRVTFDPAHISNTDYMAACLECDEDLYAMEIITAEAFNEAQTQWTHRAHTTGDC